MLTHSLTHCCAPFSTAALVQVGTLEMRVFEIKTRLPDVEECASMLEVIDCLGSEIATLKACFDYFSSGEEWLEMGPALQALTSLGDLGQKSDQEEEEKEKEGGESGDTDAPPQPPPTYQPTVFFDSAFVERAQTSGDAVPKLDFNLFLRGFFRAKREAGADNGLKRPPVQEVVEGVDAEPDPDPTTTAAAAAAAAKAAPSSGSGPGSAKGAKEATSRRSAVKKEEPADVVRRARVWLFETQATLTAAHDPATPMSAVAASTAADDAPSSLLDQPHSLVDPAKVVLCPLTLNGHRFQHGHYHDGNLSGGGGGGGGAASGLSPKELSALLYGPHVTRPQLQLMRQVLWLYWCTCVVLYLPDVPSF